MSRMLTAFLGAAVVLSLTLGAAFPNAAAPDRVEEDWQMVLATPDTTVNSPQVSTLMSPTGVLTDSALQFKLNYRDEPDYQAGGLSAQVWQGTQFVSNSDQGSAQCGTASESITWSQRMSLSGGNLNFKVFAGNSTTWGQFGVNDGDLAVSTSSSIGDLSGYSPDSSVANTHVTFGVNRVTSMTLLQVRYYQGNTLLSTDTTPRQVNLSN
jgi:hypothetical protein